MESEKSTKKKRTANGGKWPWERAALSTHSSWDKVLDTRLVTCRELLINLPGAENRPCLFLLANNNGQSGSRSQTEIYHRIARLKVEAYPLRRSRYLS